MISKLLNFIVIAAGLTISGITHATVYCVGVPSVVKVGETGKQESYLIVRVEGKDYRLGIATDDLAKSRFALATSAVVSKSRLILSFYAETSCEDASVNTTIPTSVQLAN